MYFIKRIFYIFSKSRNRQKKQTKKLHPLKTVIFLKREILKDFIKKSKKVLTVTLKYFYIYRKQKSLKNSFNFKKNNESLFISEVVLVFHTS